MEKRRVRQRAIELIEAALRRPELRLIAQVPFAYGARHIAYRFQPIRQRFLGQRQPELWPASIELMPETCLISPREQSRPRRTAIRPRHIPLREPHAVLRNRVDIRRRNLLVPLKSKFPIPYVIAKKDDEVWLGGIG